MRYFETQTVLITGGTGFVGHHLIDALIQQGAGPLHIASPIEAGNPADYGGQVLFHQVDLTDRGATEAVVGHLQPSLVFHLAAQSHVPSSFINPELTWRVNLNGTLHILDTVSRHCPGATVVNIGSSDMYGASFRHFRPVAEDVPLAPLNPYAASKAAADLAAFQYSATTSLKIIRVRPFNHSGPGQSEGFVLPAFAAQIARIEAGQQEAAIYTGDLSAKRDFLHVNDVTSAYIALARRAETLRSGSVFNVASGESVAIGELLRRLLERSRVTIDTRIDPDKLRPVDIADVCGDASALRAATGWRARHCMDDLLDDLLGYWRQKISGGLQ